jgi:hypothetical protein
MPAPGLHNAGAGFAGMTALLLIQSFPNYYEAPAIIKEVLLMAGGKDPA